jgi:hypothetical protein
VSAQGSRSLGSSRASQISDRVSKPFDTSLADRRTGAARLPALALDGCRLTPWPMAWIVATGLGECSLHEGRHSTLLSLHARNTAFKRLVSQVMLVLLGASDCIRKRWPSKATTVISSREMSLMGRWCEWCEQRSSTNWYMPSIAKSWHDIRFT